MEASEERDEDSELDRGVERSLVLTDQIIRLVHSARVNKLVAASALEAALSHVRCINNPTELV
jgi:hypothetical protein